MTRKKKIIITLSAIVLIPLLLFCSMGLYLSDNNISGFTGMIGMLRLSDNEVFVPLTDKPLQLLIRQGDEKGAYEDAFFNSWSDEGHPARGFGIKDGNKYEYTLRSFTSKYFIVALEII